MTSLGSGLVGVRVSTATPLEGFTLTREDGWFDLLVNGGGAVTLHFGRAPFKRSSQVVFVPWNEVCIFLTIGMCLVGHIERMVLVNFPPRLRLNLFWVPGKFIVLTR